MNKEHLKILMQTNLRILADYADVLEDEITNIYTEEDLNNAGKILNHIKEYLK